MSTDSMSRPGAADAADDRAQQHVNLPHTAEDVDDENHPHQEQPQG